MSDIIHRLDMFWGLGESISYTMSLFHFSILAASITFFVPFARHRMNCLNAGVEESAYILKRDSHKDKHTQLSDFIFWRLKTLLRITSNNSVWKFVPSNCWEVGFSVCYEVLFTLVSQSRLAFKQYIFVTTLVCDLIFSTILPVPNSSSSVVQLIIPEFCITFWNCSSYVIDG